ncbi:MAG: hypothetical protein Q8N55_01085 [bacterium]|nr:hypothetical protein [bacterium]
MEKGTIKKILDYYLSKQFQDETMRATKEFFNQPSLAPGGELRLEEGDIPLFEEWFLFDYKMRNGKTPLEDFFEQNPLCLPVACLQIYRDLRENYYGPYVVLEVRRGEALTLKHLQTNKVFEVRECVATFGVRVGMIFFSRVAKVADHYELIGANLSGMLDNVNKRVEQCFSKIKFSWNPKLFKEFIADKDYLQSVELFESLEQAELAMSKFLKKHELIKFINVENIKEWIYKGFGQGDYRAGLNMLMGLVHPNYQNYEQACNELIELYPSFYNLCPQKYLQGLSPKEARAKADDRGEMPEYGTKICPFPPLGWDKHYQKAFRQMKRAQFALALVEFDKVFRYMFKQITTFPEVYRFYGNKAICHFALGQQKLGKKMMDIALELNPYYDFAKRERTKYRAGFYSKRKFVRNKWFREENEDFDSDLAFLYYQMLKEYEINFAQKLKTPSPIALISNR